MGRNMSDPVLDDFADNSWDTTSPIGQLTQGQILSASLEQYGDTDYFAVRLEAGVNYVFTMRRTADPNNYIYPDLSLMDSSGTTLASADRHISNMVQFIYTAANSSTFFLSAKDKFYFGSGTYSLDFREATALGSSVAISDSQISEGDGGTKAMTFTVTRTGGTASFDVDFATLVSDRFLRIVAIPTVPPDNANNGPAGYVPVSGTLHFGEGETFAKM